MRGERRGVGVTTRIIVGVVVLTALGLVFSAVVAGIVHQRVVHARVDQALSQEVAELRTLAQEGRDAEGERFATLEHLLFEALRRNVPDHHEDFLVLIDGQIPFVASWEPRFTDREVQALAASASRIAPDTAPQLADLDHEGRRIRYVAVPVRVAGDPSQGVFVAAVDLDAEYDEATGMHRAYAVSAGLALLVVGVVSTLLLWRQLRPLRRLAATAERITEEDLSERIPEQGADDLARLTRTVNGMLDRLDRAFRDQRALLDDVGHELRTPLTIVSGHLEMMDATDPDDVAETRVLCLDELDRMSRLVDELVLLARSARPDFVDLRPTDIDDVVTGVLDRVRPLADRTWGIDATSGAVIDVDPNRLTQALLQLTSNAIRHTAEGDRIALGAVRSGDEVEVWVRDTGPGVPPEDQDAIFERFQRGSAPSGSGSGLGLSIVAAIAEAHGGRVDYRGMPGAGATFVISIPAQSTQAAPWVGPDRSEMSGHSDRTLEESS